MPQAKTVAQVFLRSPQGRSFREVASGPLPEDLSPYRATAEVAARARRHFEKAGFAVHEDDLRLALTIEAKPATFEKVFGIKGAKGAALGTRLATPAELKEIVDEIHVLTPPEMF